MCIDGPGGGDAGRTGVSARTLASGATWASGSIGLACGAAYTDGAIATLLVALAAAVSLGWALRAPNATPRALPHRVTKAVPVQQVRRQATAVPARPLAAKPVLLQVAK